MFLLVSGTHFKCAATVSAIKHNIAGLVSCRVLLLLCAQTRTYTHPVMSRSCYGLVYRCLYDTVVALLLYLFIIPIKTRVMTCWHLTQPFFMLQIWHEGQQETKSSKYRFSSIKCQKTVKVFRLRHPCLLQWFVSCRIILLKRAWTTWTHKDKQRETHYFWDRKSVV